MAPDPTPLPDGPASRLDAIPTQWSVVRFAHLPGAPAGAVAARQALVLRYAKAVRRYVGGMVRDGNDADELAQDVVMRLMRGDFAGADPDRGRFRDLLKTAVRNMIRTHWERAGRRRKTAGRPLNVEPAAADPDPDWDGEWQRVVLDHAWAALKDHEHAHPAPPTYTVLRLRTDFPDSGAQELADRLLATRGTAVRADAFRQLLRRARLRFAELLTAEVARGLSDPSADRVQEELAALGLLESVKDYLPGD